MCSVFLQSCMQGFGEVSDGGETILRGLRQGFEDDLLHLGRDFGADAPQGWRRIFVMLQHDGEGTTMEWTLSSEPLVDDDSQGVLVTGRRWFALALFRCGIGWRPRAFLLTG